MTEHEAPLSRPAISRVAFAGLILCILACWMLQHPYGGLIQDAVLYAVAAFARLRPESLGHDIFLSQGSQDHYTLFSPLVAEVMRATGVARGAELVVAASQLAFYGCGALLARRLMPPAAAILAVALLVVLPSLFGANHIFWYTEDILTPRVPASALVLASLACVLGGRFVLGGVLISGAMLLHPLMALAGVAMMYWLLIGLRRPRLTAVLFFGGLVALGAVAWWVPMGPVARFDPAWFDVLHERLQYAFPSLWTLRDWGRMSVPLSTLVVGALARTPTGARFVCRAALATGISGIAVALIGSDLLHIVIVAQVQPWRWLWVSNATAVILLPVIAAGCWRSAGTGRACTLLLVAGWISFEQTFVPVITILAVATAAIRHVSIGEREERRVTFGAGVVLLLAILFLIGSAVGALRHEPAALPSLTWSEAAFWVVAHRVRPWTIGGILPAVVFAAIWWIATRRARRVPAMAVLLAGALLCCAVAPYAWVSWRDPAPSEQDRARFASWRAAIPPAAQVLGPGVPVIPWFLLERPSYWTLRQMAGVLFSRTTATELLRRETVVHRFPPAPTPAGALDGMCRSDPAIAFIVTPVDMGSSPFAPVALADGPGVEHLHLYPCSAHRGSSGSARALPAPNAGKRPATKPPIA